MSTTKHNAYRLTGRYLLSVPFEVEVFAPSEQEARDYIAGMADQVDCAAPHTVTETRFDDPAALSPAEMEALSPSEMAAEGRRLAILGLGRHQSHRPAKTPLAPAPRPLTSAELLANILRGPTPDAMDSDPDPLPDAVAAGWDQ